MTSENIPISETALRNGALAPPKVGVALNFPYQYGRGRRLLFFVGALIARRLLFPKPKGFPAGRWL